MMAHPEQTRNRAIEGLLSGMNITEAAEYARIGRRTLHRWVAEDADFRRRLDEARQRIFDVHVAQLAQVTASAIRRLKQILDNDEASPRDWLRAAELVLVHARQTEEVSIRQEIRQLRDEITRQQV